MLSCVMATCRPVATAGQPARSAGSCKPVRGMKPLLRGERMVSFAAKEDKDDKFWGKGLSPDQVAFLARKEKFARGEGPVMPVESQCTRCKGEGSCVCPSCNGSGFNPKNKDMGGKAGLMLAENEEGKENELTGAVTAEPAVLSFSNRAEPWRFEEGMPCWVCLGKKVILCGDCSGRGFGGNSSMFGGD